MLLAGGRILKLLRFYMEAWEEQRLAAAILWHVVSRHRHQEWPEWEALERLWRWLVLRPRGGIPLSLLSITGFVVLMAILGAFATILIASWPISVSDNKLSAFGTLGQMVAAIATLIVAWNAHTITVGRPEILLTMPKRVRVEFGRITVLYIQPTFTVSNVSNRAENIIDMSLEVTDTRTGDKRCFSWQHMARFRWDSAIKDEVYDGMVSDAIPLLVAANTPQLPLAGFHGEGDWHTWFEPDVPYYLTLSAQRSSGRKPLRGTVELRMSAQALDELRKHIEDEWHWTFEVAFVAQRQDR